MSVTKFFKWINERTDNADSDGCLDAGVAAVIGQQADECVGTPAFTACTNTVGNVALPLKYDTPPCENMSPLTWLRLVRCAWVDDLKAMVGNSLRRYSNHFLTTCRHV